MIISQFKPLLKEVNNYRSSRMGVLGPNLTVHGEKMRPDLGFGKSICSPERVPFKLIREEERNECDEHRCAEPELHPFFFLSPDQPDGREQEAGTGLEVVEEEEGEEQGKVVGTRRLGQV